MRFKTLMIIAVALTAFLPSCVDDDSDLLGNWVTKATYVGKARAYGSSFAINGNGYWGMGTDDDDYLTDFWKYDPVKDTWKQVADFTGTPRAYNISASNGTKGYVGLGYDGNNDLDDIWVYDAEANSWYLAGVFPGGARRFASAFAIGNDVYVGLGSMDKGKVFKNDFYKFNGNSWTAIPALRGDKRHNANVTVLNGKAHVISGLSNNGVLNDHWVYDPVEEVWSELENVNDEVTGDAGIARYSGSTYSANGKIYLTLGGTQGGTTTSMFEWDPTLDIEGAWIEKTALESNISREGAGCFVLDGYGYIVGGVASGNYKDDSYMFQPYAEADSDDN
jgi:N-acetylneuraminic acid mutarotase